MTAETPDPKGGEKNRDEKRAENEVKNSPEKAKSVPKASQKKKGNPFFGNDTIEFFGDASR